MSRAIRWMILLVGLVGFSAVPRAATAPTAAQALHNLSANMTGIYRLAYLNSGGSQKETLALVNLGLVVEVHTRTVQKHSYLNRKFQARPTNAVNLGGSTFNQLISIAGGINQNVNNSTAVVKQNFLKTAGQSTGGSGSTPMTVNPVNGKCPAAYDFRVGVDASGRKTFKCYLKTDLPPSLMERMMAWWRAVDPVSSAYAYLEWRWTMLSATSPFSWGFMHHDNYGETGVSGWEFVGFGFQVLYLDMPGG
jgi:hypothetical protein